MKFRLPRKVKKKLKTELWLYPADQKGNRLMAFPYKKQEDYLAMKKGIVKSLFGWGSPEEKEESKIEFKALDNEIYISDEQLKKYVDDIFAEKYRNSSYRILLEAKNHPKAKKGYFNFVNAYHKNLEESSFGNICCMAVDSAKELLKKK